VVVDVLLVVGAMELFICALVVVFFFVLTDTFRFKLSMGVTFVRVFPTFF